MRIFKAKVKSLFKDITFCVEVPRSLKYVIEAVQVNGNTLWRDGIIDKKSNELLAHHTFIMKESLGDDIFFINFGYWLSYVAP